VIHPEEHMADPFTLLPSNLARVVDASARLEANARWALQGVHVSMEDGTYTVCATDGRQLAVVQGQSAHDPLDYPTIPELVESADEAASALIRGKDWKEAFRSVPRGPVVREQPILGHVAIHLGPAESVLATTDGEEAQVVRVSNHEGKFPDYQAVLPREEPEQRLNVNARLLLNLLRIACEFVDEEDSYRLTLEFRGADKPLVLRTGNASQEFVGLVMPLTREP
jgi:DNA polymerase III sliding clamp (beta) subunit (PCNA family)